MSQLTCKERVRSHWQSRKKDFEVFMKDPEGTEDLGSFYEYGLCFDYVAAGTFTDQDQGFWRYQLSTGGPGDELRFYGDPQCHIYKVEYWFLDWFDGASIDVTKQQVVKWLVDQFKETGSFEHPGS